jgi:hypothetical protein
VQLTAVAPDQLGERRLVPPLVDAEDAHALRADLGRQVAYEPSVAASAGPVLPIPADPAAPP